jgi:hypothetical protein
MDELLAIQAATAMDEGLVSPAHLLVDTFHTLYKAQKNSSSSSRTWHHKASPKRRR